MAVRQGLGEQIRGQPARLGNYHQVSYEGHGAELVGA